MFKKRKKQKAADSFLSEGVLGEPEGTGMVIWLTSYKAISITVGVVVDLKEGKAPLQSPPTSSTATSEIKTSNSITD